MNRRPLSITLLAWLLIAVGALGPASHFVEFRTHPPMPSELLSISLLGLLAVLAGIFLLRGANWARWGAAAWMAVHVGISVFHPRQELIIHGVLFVLFAYVLFRPAARAYFTASSAVQV
ncbi:MAG TPA: hypothetical protein VGG26_11030 [Terracidiphilus sp.]